MKVVFISRYPVTPDCPRGGVESVTTILATALTKTYVEQLHVLTLRHDLTQDSVDQFGKVIVHRLAVPKWPQILDMFVGPGAKKIQEKIRSISPDIVHAHETHGLALFDLNIPFLMTVHGFDQANVIAEKRRFSSLRSKLWAAVEKYCLSRHKRIASISPYVTEKIKSIIGDRPVRLVEIDNPVEQAMFDHARADDYKSWILCVGWINERKNTLASVKAFAKVLEKMPNARLRIAGTHQSNAYREKVLSLVKDLDLGKSVDFLGHIERKPLLEEIRRSAVLLLPSLQENAPMVISEAQAVGLPVVTSNRCGMQYMVSSGENGFLIEPDDIDDIANKVLSLLTDPKKNQLFGEHGRQHAFKTYHPSIVAKKTYGLYKELIDQ